jgi:hypothetical protein
MSGNLVEGVVVNCGAILLALALGYWAGARRRPPRHGTIQLRATRHRRKG